MQNYNVIIDIKDMEAGSPSNSEPVSVTEFKNYARLQSFEDNLGSTSDLSFTVDDTLIGEILTSARESLEKYTGLSFIPKELRVTLTNIAGLIELPYGPTGDVTALYYGWDFEEDGDSATNNIADLTLVGSDFKKIECPNEERMVLDYSCGYGRGDTQRLPERLRRAIMVQALWEYENRGDEEVSGLCKMARQMADPFRRITML